MNTEPHQTVDSGADVISLSECPLAPLPESLEKWQIKDLYNPAPELLAIRGAWLTLEPFFSSKGYTLYKSQPRGISLRPSPSTSGPAEDVDYPYGRRVYTTDEEAEFFTSSTRVFPARNASGVDVVIKVIADNSPSCELEIIQYLNSKELRSDPRNHTIPVIELLQYDKFTFLVMPRWGQAFWPDFGTVAELMHLTQTFLEVFDLLHENHIVHADFLEQNTAMNVIYNENDLFAKNLRDPRTTRYALIDFEGSKRYPLEIPIQDVKETRWWNFRLRGLPEPDGPYNPFSVDVLSLGLVLQRWVRHIEDIVPDLGPFFGDMVTTEPGNRPTARQALQRFNEIYSRLSQSQLHHPVANRFWEKGGRLVMPKSR